MSVLSDFWNKTNNRDLDTNKEIENKGEPYKDLLMRLKPADEPGISKYERKIREKRDEINAKVRADIDERHLEKFGFVPRRF